MLSGSVLLRVMLLLVAAAALTGLVQHYRSHDGGLPETPLPEVPEASAAARPPEKAPAPAPKPAPAAGVEATAPPAAPSPTPSMFSTDSTPAPQDQEQGPARERGPAAVPSRAPERPLATEAASASARPVASPPQRTAAVPPAPEAVEAPAPIESPEPRAIDPIDLNTASLAELNGLKGGGSIGRAIVQHRPYASVDQLLSKRVLTRSIYQRVKDQVTVR